MVVKEAKQALAEGNAVVIGLQVTELLSFLSSQPCACNPTNDQHAVHFF